MDQLQHRCHVGSFCAFAEYYASIRLNRVSMSTAARCRAMENARHATRGAL
jgi:hypothetical protein